MRFPAPKGIWSRAALLIALAALASASSFAKEEATAKSWSQKMKGLQQVLQDLLVDLNSDERFNSKKNFSRIEENAKKLANLTHELKLKQGVAPDADPTIGIIASQFSKEADFAYKTLQAGHRDYARDLLRAMTGYCMACHTRNSSGPAFQSMISNPSIQAMKGLEKADLYASTRQFDRALDEYEKVLSEPANSEHRPFDWEKAVRSSLAISVRVKKDPDRALSVVDRVLANPKAPYFLKEQATQWKLSLNTWKSEGKATAQTEQGYYALAVKLVGEAKNMQKYPADRSADILYLRASSAVHDLLSFAPNGEYATQALYLAGLCYEVLRDLNLWDQHEFYYLACILKSPHTEQSRLCFKNYEQSVYQGYTGSGGTHLPAEIKSKLQQLDLMSAPEAEKPKAPLQ